MPATPAWPPQSTPRLFVDRMLGEGPIRIDGPAAHYLVSVMRTRIGDPVKLFDDRSGEWLAVAASVGKRDLTLDVTERLREREAVPDLWLCAAPLKKGRVDWLAEKACELGVARLVPVVTRRTVVDKPNTERLRAHMIEAAEQCGRTALPQVAEPVKLTALLRDWSPERALFFADETGGAPALTAMAAHRGPAAILIGPEGGFDAEEREAIRAHPAAIGIGLGPRILRADTAAAAAVSLWMAAAGDWG
ncbi:MULTISPECIES: 16S rRNA (uracil(1498)-N(3))-methyltransferase [Sphingomonas]|jgi:16S rRNA (uracil1498-N3)-methyltransferase|uniref:Ribosomal RNA small subunit methyltransferase E n=1 Tax=Sphingomonas zeae TaxID=1646122 RepID=A0A7Y6EJ64_9SPHN|nr:MULTISPECIES: 16S rRNA (uracil(1498)-N(3))-methyltransferase [Sphingomonas]MBB4046769.1 16S rRNA (uracil1498-N3)-methyltransferase [Sphingomonas zeae]MDK8184545.1 16S rRNA (uracil(1498)-N(3))-methyltransferase [Sphingomonas zeae]MDK8214366.1 16S rRNA (uracil(1498)-N(3))-methyltransferase [Sphingomonas sp. UMB7805-LC452B]NUU48877.1 16S rRNA (uracil(1498)-N(3))-methyltransferase [Sphingomonas zeae]